MSSQYSRTIEDWKQVEFAKPETPMHDPLNCNTTPILRVIKVMSSNNRSYVPLLIGACTMLVLSFGFRAGFGLFMQPLSEAREWGRDVLAMALAIQNLAWGVCAVVVGGIADKYGSTRVMLVAIALYAAGIFAMAYSTTELQIISTAGLMVGAGVAGTSFGIMLPTIAKVVPEEQRGWAMGIGTAAGSFGQFLVVPSIQFLVDGIGWFLALQVMAGCALLMAVCVIPIAAANKRAPQSELLPAISLKDIVVNAFQVKSYLFLIAGFYVCGFHLAFITVHMPAYLVDLGFSASIGAWSISLIGLCNVVGSFYVGTLCGKHSMRKLLTLIYFARAIVISLFLVLPITVPSVLAFSAAMGFLWLATVPPTSGLVAVFFGTRYMTFLYGIVFLSHQLGSFTGVWLGGWVYETYGNYDGVWIAGIVLGLGAAALHWPIEEKDYSQTLKPALV
ncbi:MAG: MFS transporter [Pseudohongiellaceae bacterium]